MDLITLEAGAARLVIDPNMGARIKEWHVDDLQLLVMEDAEPIKWGCYTMGPYVGRIRDGRFTFNGQSYQLPLNMPPHAIHGTCWYRPWRQVSRNSFECDLGDWPFSGRQRVTYDLHPDRLEMTLEIHSDDKPFPANCGWHPWFLRKLERGGEAELDFRPQAMYERQADNMVDGRLAPPKAQPWDDCFTRVPQPVHIKWPGALNLEITADVDHWVVYSEPAHAICVEPQTGPPNAFEFSAFVVSKGNPLTAKTTMTWSRDT